MGIPQMSEDNLSIIREQIQRFGGSQKAAGEYRMVCCPFHREQLPSCGIYLRRDDPRKTLGWFNCFGCGEHGSWNKFAEKAGLIHIKEWNSAEKSIEYNSSASDEALLGDIGLTMRAVYKEMHCGEAIPWPVHMDWRGVSGELIAAVGGKAINDERNNGIAVLFPIKIGNKIRGAVKAMFHKRNPTQLGYITMAGENWVKRYGLFPFDYTARLMRKRKHDFIILVEGPRDALRLLKLGLPAMAVLGANTISKTKMLFISNLGVDQIYVMPDNDRGGTALWRNIKHHIPEVRRLKLPVEYDTSGNLIKMDPFSMPASIARTVKELMTERHGWEK